MDQTWTAPCAGVANEMNQVGIYRLAATLKGTMYDLVNSPA